MKAITSLLFILFFTEGLWAVDLNWASSMWLRIGQPMSAELIQELISDAEEKQAQIFLKLINEFKEKYNIRTEKDWLDTIKVCPSTPGVLASTERNSSTELFPVGPNQSLQDAINWVRKSYPSDEYEFQNIRAYSGYLQIDILSFKAPIICLTPPLGRLQAMMVLAHEMVHASLWQALPAGEDFLTQFKAPEDVLKVYLEEPGGEYDAFYTEYLVSQDLRVTAEEAFSLKVLRPHFYDLENFKNSGLPRNKILNRQHIAEVYLRIQGGIFESYLQNGVLFYMNWLETLQEAALKLHNTQEAQRLQNLWDQISKEKVYVDLQRSRLKEKYSEKSNNSPSLKIY